MVLGPGGKKNGTISEAQFHVFIQVRCGHFVGLSIAYQQFRKNQPGGARSRIKALPSILLLQQKLGIELSPAQLADLFAGLADTVRKRTLHSRRSMHGRDAVIPP